MNGRSWSLALILALGLGGCLSVAPGEPEEDSSFRISATSGSTAKIAGADDLRSQGAVLIARDLGNPARPEPIKMVGTAKNVTLHRFESDMKLVQTPRGITGGPQSFPTETIARYDEVKFSLDSQYPEAAIVLSAPSLDANLANGSMQVLTSVRNPLVVPKSGSEAYGTSAGPNETLGWMERGEFVATSMSSLVGNTTGALRFYWFQSDVVLATESESTRVESRVWDEYPVAGAGVFVRHIVWHEIRAAEADVQVVWPGSAPLFKTLVLAKSFEVSSVDHITMDSAENVTGSLPANAGGVAPSLWMRGTMDVQMAAAREGAASASAYRVDVSGGVVAYAVGGGSVVVWNAAAAVTAAGLVVFWAAIVFLFRDAISDFANRAWFALYSKLSHDKLLHNHVRELICTILETSPGLSFIDLRKAIGARDEGRRVGIGTLTHHVAQLERFGLVKSRKIGHLRCYFLAKDKGSIDEGSLLALRSESAQCIVQVILQRPGIGQQDLFDHIQIQRKISKSTLLYHLTKLEAANLLKVESRGHRRFYEATDALRKTLQPG